MIDRNIVTEVDYLLDSRVSPVYKAQPLAQDWARIAKMIEEIGEAISELISFTGQNPRKKEAPAAYDRMLCELADAAMTPVYAIQHFTKNVDETARYIKQAQDKHLSRLLP